MSKTPSKTDLIDQFKPREITTPSKDHQGITKTVYSHVSRFYGLMTDWLKLKEKGVRLGRAILAMELHECEDDYYPRELKPVMESLLEILDSLKNIIDASTILNYQLQALSKLQPGIEPVISTWSVSQISDNVAEILQSLEKEFKLKSIITENVAHCRDKNLIEVYISAWEFEVYLNIQTFAYLFAEVGLPVIS